MRTPWISRRLAIAVALLGLVLPAGLGQARPAAPRADALPVYLYGQDLIRAHAIVKASGLLHDYRVDRGRIKTISGSTVTLKERDNTSVNIPVASTAKIQVNGRQAGPAGLRIGMSAIVVRDGDNAADTVQASGGYLPTSWLANTYFGPAMVRLEAVVKSSAGLHDYRLDRGRIKAITAGMLTLRARDDLVVPIPVSPTARIKINGRLALFAGLRRGMNATTVRDFDEPADTVLAVRR